MYRRLFEGQRADFAIYYTGSGCRVGISALVEVEQRIIFVMSKHYGKRESKASQSDHSLANPIA